MKQIFTFLAGFLLLFSTRLYAQTSSLGSFTVQSDTESSSPAIGVSTTVEDGVSAVGTGTVTVSINWKVVASDFPADWVAAYSICDNTACYPGTGLWTPAGGTGATKTSMPYGIATIHNPGGDFHMLMDFTSGNTTGCHYMTVRMNNTANTADTATETYIICNGTTAVTSVPKSYDDVLLYPNPARDEVNVVYDPSADIKNIAVYNIIGKVLAVYKVTNSNSANLNIENIPSGIYFVRLMNSQGNVVVTRKFTKQ